MQQGWSPPVRADLCRADLCRAANRPSDASFKPRRMRCWCRPWGH